MVVKYLENFIGLDGVSRQSKVVTDCGSIRLVPDCGGFMTAVFLYSSAGPNMVIPFSKTEYREKIEYLDNAIDIHLASGVIDLSGFEAVKLSRYVDINTVAKSLYDSRTIPAVNIAPNDVKMTVEHNDEGLRELLETIKEETYA